MSWSTSELRVRLAPLNRFKPSSKKFYWPFQGGTSFVDLLCFCSVLCLLCFVRVCLYVLRGHLLGKGWPLGSRLWCLLWVCHFPIGILGQVWYLIVLIPDLCNLTYFVEAFQYMYFFSWQFQGGADFVDHFSNLYFMFLCCLYLEIYLLKTWPLPCTVVVCAGEGRNQGVARLVFNGCGIAVPDIFGAICESMMHLRSYLCAPNRI